LAGGDSGDVNHHTQIMMSLPRQLSIALKEWAVVCGALAEGRQTILLRKGGILEGPSGFEIDHSAFVLMPTYLHQNVAMVKPAYSAAAKPVATEPRQIEIALAATVHAAHKLNSRRQMDALDRHHIWSPKLIDMRFDYRPENPLYLLVVRVWRLAEAVMIENTPTYAGCKSWAPLDVGIDCNGATPAMEDAAFEEEARAIAAAIEAGCA
jgi:hypothetical protein